MIVSILLSLFVGLLTLWICKQYKYITLCEQIVVGFILGLSYAVLIVFLQGIIFNTINLIPMYVTAVLILGYALYVHFTKGLFKDVYKYISKDVIDSYKMFVGLHIWKKIVLVLIFLYGVWKIVMIFGINTTMPTYDEDAVSGWDMKTKIFYQQRSLVLDTKSTEFLGSDLSRYPFAGLVDTYLLLPLHQADVSGLTNIISPIVYLLSILLLFGIFKRVTSLFFAGIMSYVFLSIPFLFIHGIGSYWNFISGFLLFIVIFYAIDQYIDKKNLSIMRTVLPIGILVGIIRNEAIALLVITTLLLLIYSYIKSKKIFTIQNLLLLIIPIIAFLITKYIISLYPSAVTLNTGGTEVGAGLLSAALDNISKPGVFAAPFSQAFIHPDYSFFFVLFTIALLRVLMNIKKLTYILPFFVVTFVLLGVFIVTLYANVQGLGLLSHFAFVRYPLGIIHLLLFVTGYSLYSLNKTLTAGK